MTIGPVIFLREPYVLGTVDINHESIHWEQEKEMLFLPFFIWYVAEFIIKYIWYGFKWHRTYGSISFEREAYIHEEDMSYLKTRKPLAWLNFINI